MISLDLPWWFLQLHILDIRCIPEALPYFVTPKAVDEDSALLQQLPHWSACSITQALEFLTPAYKGHPRVMAYILRVLESYPPERVTFFMPQLVQALRYDDEVSNVMKTLIYACVTIYILCIITGVLSLENWLRPYCIIWAFEISWSTVNFPLDCAKRLSNLDQSELDLSLFNGMIPLLWHWITFISFYLKDW